jgi:hypothetical protein
VLGSNFDPLSDYTLKLVSATRLWTGQSPNTTNVTCQGLTVVNANTVTCTLPELEVETGYWFYDQYVTVRLDSINASLSAINTLYMSVYQWNDAPAVQSVSGCASSLSPLTASGCRSGAVITVTGSNLGGYAYSVLSNSSTSIACNVLTESVTNSSLTCQLPYFDGFNSNVLIGVPYAFYVWLRIDLPDRSGVGKRSDWFIVTFTADEGSTPTIDNSSSGSSSEAVGISVGVVIAALVMVVLGLVAWKRYRRTRAELMSSHHTEELSSPQAGAGRWHTFSEGGGVELR